jgi:nucleoside-diphosphate-sugar epimerase
MASPSLEWLCYYSTVGVYGDFGGAWIDESSETRPVNERSRQRVIVEEQWRAFAKKRGVPLLILRLAGIYGPGRSAFDKLRAGDARRIVKPNQVFNRIHVADIGRVTALAARQKLSGTFNLADDEPAPPQDLVTHAAGLIGVAPPPEVPFAEAQMTPMARSFYGDNKRVRNTAIKAALDVALLYPTYRDGLRAILGGNT